MINVLYNGVNASKLNFPERYEQYKSLTISWLEKKTTIFGCGVNLERGKYRARIGDGGKIGLGYFFTREEALKAVEDKRRAMGMIWDL